MKKRVSLFIILSLILCINLVYAIDLEITSQSISNAYIIELDKPTKFTLEITNLEAKDDFEIFSLVGVDISPSDSFSVNRNSTKILDLEVIPLGGVKSNKGFFTFNYKIKDSSGEIQDEQLTINIVNLGDAFQLYPININPKADKATLTIKNKIMYDFDSLELKFTSAFFEYEKTLSLKAFESTDILIPIDKEELKTINAGQYLVNTQITLQGKSTDKESILNFLEQEDIQTTQTSEGALVQRTEIIKKNLGNIKKTVKITSEKGIISYLFTTTSPKPTSTSFESSKKQYTWEKELIPNEELKVIIKTNWFYPIIIILLIISILIFIKRSVETDLMLRKKVSFIRTKGGQFALKITLRLKAKRFIERINIIDKLPPLVNLYERFGAIPPDNIDLKNKRLEYNIEALNKDEERVFTYIIYSKIGVVGRFELPSARASYEKEGKVKQQTSNRAFYINEPGQ